MMEHTQHNQKFIGKSIPAYGFQINYGSGFRMPKNIQIRKVPTYLLMRRHVMDLK
jgi:hypothetical protein